MKKSDQQQKQFRKNFRQDYRIDWMGNKNQTSQVTRSGSPQGSR
jgi:hypothetical protein